MNWATAGNWSSGVPSLLDEVVFGTPILNPGNLTEPRSIHLSSSSLAGGLWMRDSYQLDGGSLELGTGMIRVDYGHLLHLESLLAGSNGLTVSGGGAVWLGNAGNSYTGVTTINNGTVIINQMGALGSDGSAVVINGSQSRGFGGGALVLNGLTGPIDFSRDLLMQGRGPITDRSAALVSVGSNTLSGNIQTGLPVGITPQNTAFSTANGVLTLSGSLDVGGTATTTFTTFGVANSVGMGSYAITGLLTGTGSIEKTGAGTLMLNPSDASGFAGTIRATAGTIRVTDPAVLGTNAGTTTAAAIDLNGGIFEFRMDTPTIGKNVYYRSTSTSTSANILFADHAIGSDVVNGTATFGALRFNSATTAPVNSFSSRNGYGMRFGAASVEGTGNSTWANNLGGLLTIGGNLWSINTTTVRTLSLGGNGNTLITGSLLAAGAAHNFTKTGSGVATILGAGATILGNINVNGGQLAITDFRSINNNEVLATGTINIGSGTTAGVLTIGTTTLPTAAGLTTNRTINLASTTGAATINASQPGAFPVVINSNLTATGAGAKTLFLSGTSTVNNTINGSIPNSSSNTALSKTGSGTWVLAGTNTYSGVTTLANGVLKLQANAPTSTIINDASGITFNAINVHAGATLEFLGQNGVDNVETVGALTPTQGSNTIRLSPGTAGSASMVFASLGTVGSPASVNFVTPGGSSTFSFTAALPAASANNMIAAGLYFNGADFAFNEGGTLRAPNYGVDADFAIALSALTAGQSNRVDGSFSEAAALTIDSLKVNGSHVLDLEQALTIRTAATSNATGGILQTGGAGVINGAGVRTGGSGALVIRVNEASDSLTLNAPIVTTSTGGFTKTGAGSLIFGGVNLQTGTNTINEGTVIMAPGSKLSANNATLNIRAAGTLDLNGVDLGSSIGGFNSNGVVTNSSSQDVTLRLGNGITTNGTAGTSYGVIEDGAGGGRTGVTVSTSNNNTTQTTSFLHYGNSTYTGPTTLTKTTNGNLNLQVYTLADIGEPSGIGRGNIDDNAGSLVFDGKGGRLTFTGVVVDPSTIITAGSVSASTNRLFTIAGEFAEIAASAGNNNALVFSNYAPIAMGTASAKTLVLRGSSTADNRFNPQLTDSGVGADITSLIKTDAGVWVLGNPNNTYSGPTVIQQGTLIAQDGASLPTASNLVLDGGTFQSAGVFTRALGTGAGEFRFATPAVGTSRFVGFAGGDSKFTVELSGNPVWGVTPHFLDNRNGLILGANNGTTAVGLSEVEIAGAFSLGAALNAEKELTISTTNASATITVTTGDTSGLVVGQTVTGPGIASGAYITAINSATSFTVSANSSATATGVVATVVGNAMRSIRVDTNLHTQLDFGTLSGEISGEAGSGIRKLGGGVLRLTGDNTYTGETSVYQGTLMVTSLGNSSQPGLATSVGLSTDAHLATNAITLGNSGTGAAILQYAGLGEVSDRMIRLNSTTGTNQIHADGVGPLVLTNVDNTFATGNKILALRGSNTQGNMITSQLSDNGGTLGVTVDGGATWILTNPANDYTGITSVSAGALGIGHDNALGDGTGFLDFGSSSVFAFGGDRTVANPTRLVNNTAIAFIGDYALNFTNTLQLRAAANNVTLTNTIGSGKTVTFGGDVTANEMTATRTWSINGTGDTVLSGSITTSTAFGLNITYSGTGSLTLGGTASNWNNGTLSVTNGTLKLGNNEVIPDGVDKGNVVLSPALDVTARLDVNGFNETINGLTAITAGTAVIDNSAAGAGALTFGGNDQPVTFIGTVQNTGAGALSIGKIGAGTALLSQGPFQHQGATSVAGGALTFAADVSATSALSVTGAGSLLAIANGFSGSTGVTTLTVGDGATLSLFDGQGTPLSGLSGLSLGSLGGTLTTLNLELGEGGSDTLSLLGGGILELFAGNEIRFNMSDVGMQGNATYTLLQVADGGLDTIGLGSYLQGLTPGGFDSYNWIVTDNQVQLQVGNLVTGSLYWTGGVSSQWNGDLANWVANKAGTLPTTTLPGSGIDVVFAADSVAAAPLVTTLEQNFRVRSLSFEGSATTPASVTIDPGANPLSRLDIAGEDGISIAAGGPEAVTINAQVKVGTAQTWAVADASSALTVTTGLVGDAPLTIAGAGKVILSAAADSSFAIPQVTVASGVLEVGNIATLGSTITANAANLVLNGGKFYLNNAAGSTMTNSITLNGGTFSAAGNSHTFTAPITVAGDSVVDTLDAVNGTTGRTIRFSNTLTGVGKLTLSGAATASGVFNQITGTLRLDGSNVDWSGGMHLLSGTVDSYNENALGTGAVSVEKGRILFRGPATGSTWNVLSAGLTVDSSQFPQAVMEIHPIATGIQGGQHTTNISGTVTLGGGIFNDEPVLPFLRLYQGNLLSNLIISGNVVMKAESTIHNSSAGSINLGVPNAITGVISEDGGSFGLRINADTSWGSNNFQILRLEAANTFTGPLTVGAGVLEFTQVGDSGVVSNLGAGSSIILGTGNLRFIGDADQSTDRLVTLTGAGTLSASGSDGTRISYNGLISTAGNSLNLQGNGISSGLITGGVEQTGTAADINVQSGNWTLSGAPIILGDDVIMTGASVLTLGGTGILNTNGGANTDARVFVRGDSVLNLAADNPIALPILNGNTATSNVASGYRGIALADGTTLGTGTLNMNGFNAEIHRLDIGAILPGYEGFVNGAGSTLTVNGNVTDYSNGLRLFRGEVNADLAGNATVLKQGLGTVVLSGDNSGLTGSVITRVDNGVLRLNYASSNASKLPSNAGLDMRGAEVVVDGGVLDDTVQTVVNLTLASGGASQITVMNSGFSTTMNLGPITRASSAGTLRLAVGDNSFVTTTSPNNSVTGLLGTGASAVATSAAYATIKDSSGTWFARANEMGQIVPMVSDAKNDLSSWSVGDHVTDTGAGFVGQLNGANVNSLRFDAPSGSNVVLVTNTGLSLGSGGILVTDQVSGGVASILGGTLSSAVTDIVVTHDGSAPLSISSNIGVNMALTKSGAGTLLLSGNNVQSGIVRINEGTVRLVGGNAIGDNARVLMGIGKFSTLELLADEAFGSLEGGSTTNGLREIAQVNLGAHTLTLNSNTGGNRTYSGQLAGTGTLIKNGAGTNTNLNFNNISTAFTGAVVINGGLFQMSNVGQINASSFTVNRTGTLLLDNNGTTRSGTRILDSTPVILNSADGGTSAAPTVVRGFTIQTDQNTTTNETIGNLIFNSGANYLSGQASGGTSAQASVLANDFIRSNAATLSVRGRNLGGTSAERNQFRISNAANQTAFLESSNLVGGAGALGSTNQKVVPWAIGENLSAAVANNNMGNTLVTYVAGRGFIPLNFATEYANYADAAADDNVRMSFFEDVTGLTGKTVNALVLDQQSFAAAPISFTGTGAGQQLINTSGAFLFTIGDQTGVTLTTHVGGFDDGIAVGGSEYVMHVVNPTGLANSSVNQVVLNSPLVSAADLTKSGRGTLILTTANVAGGGAHTTTLNEGILEIAALDQIGGSTGDLVFGGGTLRVSASFDPLADDLSARNIRFLPGGGTLDTNGQDLVFAGSLGSGFGGFTKVGAGSLTLNAAASYVGPTVLTNGVLALGADNAIGRGDLSLAAGTTLALDTHSIQVGLVTTAGASPNITGTGTIDAAGGFFFNHTGNTAVQAALAGPGGLLKAQTNTLTLTGASSFGGRVEVRAGTLIFDSISPVGGGASALGSPSTAVDGMIHMGLTTTATALTYIGSGHESDRAIGLQGTTGGLTINADGTGGVSFGMVSGLTPGAKTLTLTGTAEAALINAINGLVEGAATLTVVKNGLATWSITGPSTHSGLTSVNAGVLNLRDGRALGGSDQGTTVATGATLQLEGGITVEDEALAIGGLGAAGQSGALVNVSGDNVFGGAVTLSAGATFAADAGTLEFLSTVSGFGDDLTVAGAGGLIFTGDLGLNTGRLIHNGSGLTTLLGNNTMTGGVLLNAGTLALGSAGALGDLGDVQLAGGTLQFLVGGEVDVSERLLLGVGSDYRIDADAGASVTFASALGGAGGLIKMGEGTLTLTADNTFEGPVTISAGKLGLVSQNGLGASPLVANLAHVSLDGGTLLANASFTLDDLNRGIALGAAGGTFEVEANQTLTVASVLTGPGDFAKTGLGTLLFTTPAAYLGSTTILGGTLALGVDNALPATDLILGSGGALDVGSFSLSVASLQVGGTGASISGTGAIDSATGFALSPSGTAEIGTNLSGTGGLTKSGEGSVILTGTNTYTGGTTISEGALFVEGSLASGLVDVQTGAVLGGTGFIAGDVSLIGTITDPAILRPGAPLISSGIDLLTIDGSLTLGEYSMVEFYLSQTGFTQLAVGAITSIDATARFKFNLAEGYIPAAGASFPVLDWGATLSPGGDRLGIANWIPYLILPDLGPEFVWATSDFGLLGIVAADGTADPLVFTADPEDVLALEGQVASFTAAVNGPEPILIQWYKATSAVATGTLIQGANALTYTIPNTAGADAGFYYARATNANNLSETAESARAELDVVTTPRIVTHPVGTTVFPTVNVTFEVEAIGPGTLSYVWNRNGSPVVDAPNAPILTITGVTAANAGSYTVTVSNLDGEGQPRSTTSAAAVLNVLEPIVFDTQPQNVTVPEGNPATFSVAVSGDGPFTYQWRRNGVDLPGEEADTLTVIAATNNAGSQGSYTVVVSNAYASLLSNVAALTLGPVQVIIDDQPLAQIVQTGGTLNLSVTSSGGKPQTFQWLFKGSPIAGETSETLSIPNMTLARAGLYTCRVSNNLASGSSTALTAAAAVSVVDATNRQFVVNEPGIVSLSVTAAADKSDVLAYQWFVDDGVTLQLVPGANARTFRPTGISAGKRRFFCQVTAAGGTETGGDNVVFIYNQPPVFVASAWALPATTVSEEYFFRVPIDGQTVDPQLGGAGDPVPEKMPVSYRATGLPAGLRIDSQGVISGRATVDGTFTVTLTATNARGTTTPLVKTLIVAPLSDNVIGEFVGPVDRDQALTGNLGGSISVRTTKKGTYTGRVTLGARGYPFRGALNPLPGSAGASVVVSRGRTLPPVTLTFALDAATGLINRSLSSISDGVNSVGFDGWRYVWAPVRGQPPTAAALGGYYTMALSLPSASPLIGTTANENIPQGNGFASFTVNPSNGRLRVVGRLADGTAFNTATYAGPGGEVMIFRTLYAANARGSVVGSVKIDDLADTNPDNNTVAGSVTWWRPVTPGTTARLYRAGFDPLDLTAVGSRYIAPVSTSPNPRVLGLTATALGVPNAVVEFTQGLVEGQLPLMDPANAALNEINLRIDERNRALATDLNPRGVTLVINARTGAISGRFTLEVLSPVRVRRVVSYSGIIVGDGVQPAQGQGYFLLPKLPASALEKPTSTSILSGLVIFDSL
jgi:autotransporter-associated beta strand protein